MTNRHPKYENIKYQFISKWKKRETNPYGTVRVQRILQIDPSPERIEVFKKMTKMLGGEDTVERRFHGTSSLCDIGIRLNAKPCNSQDCCICNICRIGFKLTQGKPFQRYGSALYFSSVSGKSNDYANKSERIIGGKRWRCMFLCKVITGRVFKTKDNGEHFTGPPKGFNSVLGEVGHVLNYDELVVYDPKQVLPSYLIVYTM
mmetsp:Transcript_23227/g.25794  ORF Transcript_23227/g.25794 Transcript_23227/m.25794 type:complete len:203 (-) Transcript_23227:56-664(-)